MNGLDLFSGIGGLTIGLGKYIRPITYCEYDRYCQSELLSRMRNKTLPTAPIWDDVRTLSSRYIPPIDIIYGGFPCQDISVAGTGKGLAGERSGLFFEILRLSKEIRPKFIFLENVPAIRTRGASRVGKELASLGYDCRWDTLSAAEIGAHHKRERWFLLAYAYSERLRIEWSRRERRKTKISSEFTIYGSEKPLADTEIFTQREPTNQTNTESARRKTWNESLDCSQYVADPLRSRLSVGNVSGEFGKADVTSPRCELGGTSPASARYWEVEPDVGRVADGVSFRVDRLRSLGNSVVPLQAKIAFERLMGL